ncbi:MAG: Fur family transcriptional regulator [Arcobacteraceae bacterium]
MKLDSLERDLKELIQSKGMRYTEQRAIILEILLMSDGHLNADEILRVVRDKYPETNIGIATVYRTLSFLEESNLISSISFGLEGKKYENVSKEHHDHLICKACGTIYEFIDADIEAKQEQIAKDRNFEIHSHSMQIYGLCENCH